MEPASFWRLPRPDRSLQTTLPAQASGNFSARQSASARFRVRLSLELQGSQFNRGATEVNLASIIIPSPSTPLRTGFFEESLCLSGRSTLFPYTTLFLVLLLLAPL